MDTPAFTTYQLHIQVPTALRIAVGRLGTFLFPAGEYVYTGSAKCNFQARIDRHLRKEKALRWHIDYLLAAPGVSVTSVHPSRDGECILNQASGGQVIVPGFGASDCTGGCGSHLKYLGPAAPVAM